MKRPLMLVLLGLVLLISSPAASYAHFLWLNCVDGKVHVYFGEDASPDDPELLKLVTKAEVWGQTKDMRGKAEVAPIIVKPGKESLLGDLPAKAGAIGLNHNYGVMSRGGETFSLRYYAKTYTPAGATKTDALEDKERLPLEIVPHWVGKELVLKVTWQGKPAVDAEVVLSGAGLSQEEKTNDKGEITLSPTTAGLLSVRAKLVENKTGSQDGKSYTSIRHYSTLTLPIEPRSLLPTEHHLAPLERGITSFGGAVLDDYLYVYGGHFGSAHHYSEAGQSGEFRRLPIDKKGAWETLKGGPKLTGLALVPYHGKLYRVGGFTAKNTEDKEQDLWSQDSFASFDPTTGAWTELPALPAGRSSHDAAVLDGKLYVVGGWSMKGDEGTDWHTKALVCDLTQPKLQWKEFDVAFVRRAVSVAAYKDKLYVLGGMKEEGGPTTRTDVYDPATNKWTQGPALQGTTMDGFGTSSFAVGDRLLVSTISGSVQQLSADGKEWKLVGQLEFPRFFHRLLPTAQEQAIIVGGASMVTGKLEELELLNIVPPSTK